MSCRKKYIYYIFTLILLKSEKENNLLTIENNVTSWMLQNPIVLSKEILLQNQLKVLGHDEID